MPRPPLIRAGGAGAFCAARDGVRERADDDAGGEDLLDRESGDTVPDYVSDPFALFQRFGEWGYRVFARGGETLDDGREGFSVMAENPDHGTMTVRSQTRGRAYCQVALEIVRSVEEIGPSDGG